MQCRYKGYKRRSVPGGMGFGTRLVRTPEVETVVDRGSMQWHGASPLKKEPAGPDRPDKRFRLARAAVCGRQGEPASGQRRALEGKTATEGRTTSSVFNGEKDAACLKGRRHGGRAPIARRSASDSGGPSRWLDVPPDSRPQVPIRAKSAL